MGYLTYWKKTKVADMWALEERNEGLVMGVTEGEIRGRVFTRYTKTARIDDVTRWTIPAARRMAFDRL